MLKIQEPSAQNVLSVSNELPPESDAFTAHRGIVHFDDDSNDFQSNFTNTDTIVSSTDNEGTNSPVPSVSGIRLRSRFIQDQDECVSKLSN